MNSFVTTLVGKSVIMNDLPKPHEYIGYFPANKTGKIVAVRDSPYKEGGLLYTIALDEDGFLFEAYPSMFNLLKE